MFRDWAGSVNLEQVNYFMSNYDLENSLCAVLSFGLMFIIPRVVTWREWRGAGQRPGQTGYNLTRSPGPRLKNTCSQNLSWNEIDIQFQGESRDVGSLSSICVVGWLFLSQSMITTIYTASELFWNYIIMHVFIQRTIIFRWFLPSRLNYKCTIYFLWLSC